MRSYLQAKLFMPALFYSSAEIKFSPKEGKKRIMIITNQKALLYYRGKNEIAQITLFNGESFECVALHKCKGFQLVYYGSWAFLHACPMK